MINLISPPPRFLIKRYKNWKSNSFQKNLSNFKKLSSRGQKPSAMVISCCDSRVHPTSIFRAEEGEFFIHRNIANFVPPYSSRKENYGILSTLEYAIKELKVKHLIILGHTDCGGIKAAYKLHLNSLNKKYNFINKWLELFIMSYDNIDKKNPKKKQLEQLEKETIKTSIKNLFSYNFIKTAVRIKKLSIHGLIHNIGTGQLQFLNPATKDFEKL